MDDSRTQRFKTILNDFLYYAKYDIDQLADQKVMISLFLYSSDMILEILADAKKVFMSEPAQLATRSPCVIVGDLHGHLLDLLRVLKYHSDFYSGSGSTPCEEKKNTNWSPQQSSIYTNTSSKSSPILSFNTNGPSHKNNSNHINNSNVNINLTTTATTTNNNNNNNLQKFVFLGDIVDRGEFSLETCLIVFLLKILYPSQIFIIRGNHEFDSLCGQFGFHQELYNLYRGDTNVLYNEFLSVFSHIPLSIVIDQTVLCVHGGIGPSMHSNSQLTSIKKPIDDFETSEVASSLLWSDPSDTTHLFKESTRGTGYLFGKDATAAFLKNAKKTILIRGHKCVQSGVESKFNGTCITVFTASNYCGFSGNKAGVLIVSPGSKFDIKRYPPLKYLTRANVEFKISPSSPSASIGKRAGNCMVQHQQHSQSLNSKAPAMLQLCDHLDLSNSSGASNNNKNNKSINNNNNNNINNNSPQHNNVCFNKNVSNIDSININSNNKNNSPKTQQQQGHSASGTINNSPSSGSISSPKFAPGGLTVMSPTDTNFVFSRNRLGENSIFTNVNLNVNTVNTNSNSNAAKGPMTPPEMKMLKMNIVSALRNSRGSEEV